MSLAFYAPEGRDGYEGGTEFVADGPNNSSPKLFEIAVFGTNNEEHDRLTFDGVGQTTAAASTISGSLAAMDSILSRPNAFAGDINRVIGPTHRYQKPSGSVYENRLDATAPDSAANTIRGICSVVPRASRHTGPWERVTMSSPTSPRSVAPSASTTSVATPNVGPQKDIGFTGSNTDPDKSDPPHSVPPEMLTIGTHSLPT